MFLDQFYSETDEGIVFSREQSSRFAKTIADDYNPIHDTDSKRFCVPGDLLFSLLVARKGVHADMSFSFAGMVGDGVPLRMDDDGKDTLTVVDNRGKEYLHGAYAGEANHDAAFIETLVRRYVRFSGHNFPHVLQPLMQQHQVMINPARPLVIYESMHIQLNSVSGEVPDLVALPAEMVVDGKRGNVTLRFAFREGESLVGEGVKHVVISGLRPYDTAAMDEVVARYNERKKLGVV